RAVQLRPERRSSVPGKTLIQIEVAGNSRDNSVRHLANTLGQKIAEVEIAARIDGDTDWNQDAAYRGDSFSYQRISATRNRRDDALRRNFANPAIARVGDIDVPRVVHSHAERPIQRCACRRPAISGKACLSVAGHCGDDPVRGYFANPVIALVGNEEITCAVHRDTIRTVEYGIGGRTAVSGVT